jgi:hypothetical protein
MRIRLLLALTALLLGSVSAPLHATDLFSVPRADFPVGTSPTDVAAGDIDRDGLVDLAIANYGSNTVTLLRNAGAGQFTPMLTVSTLAGPRTLALADINHDGNLDLIIACSNTGRISYLLGHGNGQFDTRVDKVAGGQPSTIAVGDVNGDGILDVVFPNTLSGIIVALVSDASGPLGHRVSSPAGTDPYGVVLADLDGDHVLDVATAVPTDNVVAMFKGSGTGAFQPWVTIPTGAGTQYIAGADFDGDGRMDLAVGSAKSSTVQLLLNTNAGFALTANTAVPAAMSTLFAGDADGDGTPDLVVGHSSTSQLTQLHVTAGTSVSLVETVKTGTTPMGMVLANLGGDGRPDLAVALAGIARAGVYITRDPNALQLTVSPQYPLVSQDVTITATLLPPAVGAITFAADDVPFTPVPLDANGVAVLHTSALTVGTHVISAVFHGGLGDPVVTATPDTIQVMYSSVATTTSLVLDTHDPVYGGAVRMTASTSPPDAQGAIFFYVDNVAIGSIVNTRPAQSFTTTNLTGGKHVIVARFVFNDPYAMSQSAPETLTVHPAPTRITITSSAEPSAAGAGLTFSTRTFTQAGVVVPSGSIVFSIDGVQVGTSLSDANGNAVSPRLTPSAGRHLVTATVNPDVFSLTSSATIQQRVFSPGPTIRTMHDVPADQGRAVRITAWPSANDMAGASPVVTRYAVFRRIPPQSPGALTGRPAQAELAGWDQVASYDAFNDTLYNVVVPTNADSNASGLHRDTYFVRAATGTPAVYYDSAPDSAYSVDDLAPPAPVALTAASSAGVTALAWSQPSTPDLASFRVYRGVAPDFALGAAAALADVASPAYRDAASSGYWYKVTAIDVNGNESVPASVLANGTTGVGGGAGLGFALARPARVPLRGGALEASFTLPTDAPAALQLLDVSGRMVAAAPVRESTVGAHTQVLARVSDLAPGVYLVRLTQAGRSLTQRVVVTR